MRVKQRLYIFCWLATMLAALQVRAQVGRPVNKDSLFRELAVAKEDTNKAKLLIRIGQVYAVNDPDSALLFYKASGRLSEQLGFTMGTLRYIAMYTAVLIDLNRYDESISLNLQAIDISQKLGNKRATASAYNNIAAAYFGKSAFEKCLDSYLKAEMLLDELNDKKRLAMIYGNLSEVYGKLHQPQKGYEYGMKGIGLCRSLGDDYNLSLSLINTAKNLDALGRPDQALTLFHEAAAVARKIDDKTDELTAISEAGEIYRQKGQYGQVRSNAGKALALATELKSNQGICASLLDIALYHFYAKNYDTAKVYTDRAMAIARKNDLAQQVKDAYKMLGDIALAQGNLESFNENKRLNDSLGQATLSGEILKNTQELEAKYSLVKKQAQVDSLRKEKKIQALELRQRNIINRALVVTVLVILVIALLYYRNYRQKRRLLLAEAGLQQQKIMQLEKEKQLAATQAVLQGQDEERIRLAKDLHDGLGGMLSGIKFSFGHMKENLVMTVDNQQAFERSMDMLDSSIRELRRVAHNMMPESLLKLGLDASLRDMCHYMDQPGMVQVNYQSIGLKQVSVDKNIAVNVYRIIQELLNNALKHARATQVLVQVILQDGQLSVTVEDNGKGFDPAALTQAGGMGWASIRNRIAYMKGRVDVQSSPEKGTSVFIEINTMAL